MGPALQRAYDTGVKPLVANEITAEQALSIRILVPAFMISELKRAFEIVFSCHS
jgi:flagellar biosynthesis protein FliP